MRTYGCPGTLHGLSGRPQVSSIREQADLRHLLSGDLRRAEAIHRGSDPATVEVLGMNLIPDMEKFGEMAAILQHEGGLSRFKADYVVQERLH